MRSKNSIAATSAAVFAALYTVGVAVLAPISFQIFQVRLADALLPLAIVFGWPAIIGLTIGAFVANFFGGLGPVDIAGGAAANFVATFAAWRVARNKGKAMMFLGVALEVALITLIVGGYLSYLFGMPLGVGLLGVLLGSVVAIGILGTMLLFGTSAGRIARVLRSYGLVLYIGKSNAGRSVD